MMSIGGVRQAAVSSMAAFSPSISTDRVSIRVATSGPLPARRSSRWSRPNSSCLSRSCCFEASASARRARAEIAAGPSRVST